MYQKKIDLTYLTGNFYCRFLHTKKHPRGVSIHEIKESFPLKPSLVGHQQIQGENLKLIGHVKISVSYRNSRK